MNDQRKIVRIKRDVIERSVDEVRSVEIQMMRALMRRYPDKAKEVAFELFKLSLTKRDASSISFQ
jgi:hypothetical protein